MSFKGIKFLESADPNKLNLGQRRYLCGTLGVERECLKFGNNRRNAQQAIHATGLALTKANKV